MFSSYAIFQLYNVLIIMLWNFDVGMICTDKLKSIETNCKAINRGLYHSLRAKNLWPPFNFRISTVHYNIDYF